MTYISLSRNPKTPSVPLVDIPLMIVSFMLSQVLMFSLLTVLYQTTSNSGPLATLGIHLLAMVLWSAQFVWCVWMLNCPVLDLRQGVKIVLNKKN